MNNKTSTLLFEYYNGPKNRRQILSSKGSSTKNSKDTRKRLSNDLSENQKHVNELYDSRSYKIDDSIGKGQNFN